MNDAQARSHYESAVRSNMRDLLAYLERRVEVRADAAEYLNYALLAAWRKRRHIPVGYERPWLFVFARNTLLNARRTARRRSAPTDQLRNVLARDSGHESLSTPEIVEIRTAVALLPDELRELVELVHWEGLTIVDSARVLGVHPSTARSRYASAKQLLRRQLGDEEEPTTAVTALIAMSA
ncbi:RNA polymerase sigma factor [Agromyces humatus]|uniref:RNA polymerase sigma factor n=1 Tax=Agromyces humatus TaxID=279573 RepID=UPI001E63F4A8|nr:RNA polymerase sigma factor [Agromyces humatus]